MFGGGETSYLKEQRLGLNIWTGDRKAKAKGMVAAIWNIWRAMLRWQLKDNV